MDVIQTSTPDAALLYDRIAELPGDLLRFQGYRWPDDDPRHATLRTVFSKKKAAFRKPQTSSITQTYVYGPAYELKDITLRGQKIQTRPAPANAVAYRGDVAIGSCPFFYVNHHLGDIIKLGRILIGASAPNQVKTEAISIPDGTKSVFISEQEPELTHLELVSVRTPSGQEQILAENVTVGPGRTMEIDIPEDFRKDAIITVRGYYDPYYALVGLPAPTSDDRALGR